MKKITNMINKKIPEGSFTRNVITVMTGTTFSQILLLLITPILTRLYSPEDFGLLSLIMSVVGIISVGITLSYDEAIVLPDNDEDAVNLLLFSILIAPILSIIIGIIFFIFRYQIADIFGNIVFAEWVWIIPIGLLSTGYFRALNYWCIRRKEFKLISARKIAQSGFTSIIKISGGLILKGNVFGLIFGQYMGQSIPIIQLARKIWSKDKVLVKSSMDIISIKKQLSRYKKFPLFKLPTSLLNTGSTQIPNMLLSSLFGPAVLGYYALSQKVFSGPMNIIGEAYNQVFLQKMSEYYNRKLNLSGLILKSYKKLFAITIIPSLFLFIFSPILFEFFFGEEWIVAGYYTRILIPSLTTRFIISPSTGAYSIINRQEIYLVYQVFLFTFRILAILYGGIYLNSPIHAITLFSIVGVVGNILSAGLIVKLAKNSWGELS